MAMNASRAGSRGVPVPAARRRAAEAMVKLFERGMRVALITHVNADGDGAGSEVAMWHLLTKLGLRAAITNPTPFPTRYSFLLEGIERADKSHEAVRHLERADAVVVLDISDVGRLGQLGAVLERRGVPVACIDHHVSSGKLPDGPRLVDAKACATAELVYDLARAAKWKIDAHVARALYVAMLTDTGGFRFSNTAPRTLHVAGNLLEHGVEPEEIYRLVYASEPEGRVRIIADVLETLVVEPDGLAWVTVPPGALERHGLGPDQLEGIVEYPRSIRGVRLALLFRRIANGRTKVSFRSVGDVDVAELAAKFGGGGHRRASGASIAGDLAEVQEQVLAVARAALA